MLEPSSPGVQSFLSNLIFYFISQTLVQMSTERDLMMVRDELNNTGRKLTTACIGKPNF